jgi:hypothetical protein
MELTGRSHAALELLQAALDAVDDQAVSLSKIVRMAIRIARLRQDYDSLLWLELEMHSLVTNCPEPPILDEIRPHFTADEWTAAVTKAVSTYTSDRRLTMNIAEPLAPPTGGSFGWSVPELERKEKWFDQEGHQIEEKGLASPRGPAAWERLRYMAEATSVEIKSILERIRQRVHRFLSITETEIHDGQTLSGAFERNRAFVEQRLHSECPVVLSELHAGLARRSESGQAANAQTALSCRRALKALADVLYPPKPGLTLCSDGQNRELTDDKYLNRLRQFISEKASGGSYAEALRTSLSSLGEMIEAWHVLHCRGVHSDISDGEADSCVIQTYLMIGDILRLTAPPRPSAGEIP